MRQRIDPPSPVRTAETSWSGDHAGNILVLDGTAVPPGPTEPPRKETGGLPPHGWWLVVLLDAASCMVVAVRLVASDAEAGR